MTLFRPIFETVWKRLETKVFLSIAVLFPLIFLASTFLPEESNFMKPGVEGDYLFSYVDMFQAILNTTTNLILPMLTLFYIAFNVFRSEADSHILCLYKDLKRRDIFLAKLASLVVLALVFLGLYTLTITLVYYGRIIHMPYASPAFFSTDSGNNAAFIMEIWTFLLNNLIGILLAACLSLYSGKGATLSAAFAYSLLSMLFPIFGGLVAKLTPTGYFNYDTYHHNLLQSMAGAGFISLVYILPLAYFTYKRFKNMEY
ncbi:hypothetical protein [Streptococcus saliviloxodontae]|uniref:Uncharacterized protein n=1 Tax=Streptococcus saliviloxodontae TaxID=1349416 RepID=A0ABS2PLJ1_9STRE|nr:hypothetical protein [Streptococcus saliviloxodontae]MBM7636305.1 hypothetical protein [Streptococcus saliviloxodontae]